MKNETAQAPQVKNFPAGAAIETKHRTMNTAPEKTWLVVDDSEEILTTVSAQFEALTGAAIECHRSPKSALEAFATAPEKYELVVTDYEMPGMNGIEFCRLLKALVPDQKIILTTGSYLFTLRSARNVGFSGLLNKPFHLHEMIAALADVGLSVKSASAA